MAMAHGQPISTAALEAVRDRESLFAFLRDALGWPLDPEDTFTYDAPPVPGEAAARVRVTQIVPFTAADPFLIMLAEFQTPIRRSDLRDVLRGVRKAMRGRAAYEGKGLEDIVFVCTTPDYGGIRFAHFREVEGRQPRLSVFGWNRDTVTETRTLRQVNLPALWLDRNLLGEPDWTPETCKRWIAAWDVEAVTKQFFREFHETFDRIKARIAEASAPAVSSHDLHHFTLTLMNRMLFCWFIQQKKWLAHDPIYLTRLWEQLHVTDQPGDQRADTFYRDYLRPLFLQILNTPLAERDPALVARMGEIPYLNGGLFEENALDKRARPGDGDQEIAVPNAAIDLLLSERLDAGRPRGLFQRWHFTVLESTPLDVDVAVDPEMLGKVFEELMNEITGDRGDTKRHETGAYYTPRPIVSFMCREALKGYLGAPASGRQSDDPIARFVDEHDAGGLRDPEGVLEQLRRIRVCDPACGSGAYLLGMLSELMALRRVLFTARHVDPRSDYKRKLDTIQHSLYGVDIEPAAVEIARLRLWLSLVVDYDDGGNIMAVPALPNLDFKVECGDSLAAPDPQGGEQPDMFRQQDILRFQELKARYADPDYHGDKDALRREIAALRAEIAAWAHPGQRVEGFDWRVEFAEVFETGDAAGSGFDVILANPPYVRQELIKDQKPRLKAVYGDLYSGTADLYVFFYYRALQLLKRDGMLVFISSNKWLRAGYGAKLRYHMAQSTHVQSIIDFGELPVFSTAATFPMIIVAQKGEARGRNTCYVRVRSLEPPFPDVAALVSRNGTRLPDNALSGADWTLTDADGVSFMNNMKRFGIRLGEYPGFEVFNGIKTGLNAAFVISALERDHIIKEDPTAAEVIKPFLVGDAVRRWRTKDSGDFLIYLAWSDRPRSDGPIYRHLERYRTELESRDCTKANGPCPWYSLSRPRPESYARFSAPKIVWPIISREPRFTIDESGAFFNDKVFGAALADRYLLGVLNSSVAWQYLKSVCSVLGDEDAGGRLELRSIHVEKLPIPDAPEADRAAIAALVQQCLDARGVGVAAQEAEINARVARLYGV